jgi:hypothetical protein
LLADAPVRYQWALVNDGRKPVAGEKPLAELLLRVAAAPGMTP